VDGHELCEADPQPVAAVGADARDGRLGDLGDHALPALAPSAGPGWSGAVGRGSLQPVLAAVGRAERLGCGGAGCKPWKRPSSGSRAPTASIALSTPASVVARGSFGSVIGRSIVARWRRSPSAWELPARGRECGRAIAASPL
jgi:hypothetical protein